MYKSIKYTLITIALLLLQILICNHIMLFDAATPIIFIYIILVLPIKLHVNWVLSVAFLLGFIVDIFSDTPGVNTISCTVLAICRKPVFHLYISKDELTTNIDPGIDTMGLFNFVKYTGSLVSIYCIIMFSLEYFSIHYLRDIIVKGLSSSVLSFSLITGLNSLMVSRSGKRL